MSSAHAMTQQASPFSRFFRNPDTGDVVVFQMPNTPLWVFMGAAAAHLLFSPHGTVGTATSIVGTASLSGWAALEVARGDSPFRRVLGGAALVAVVVGLQRR